MSGNVSIIPSSGQIEQNFEAMRFAVASYDPTDPAASYLRRHQVAGVAGFREAALDGLTIDAFAEGTGVAMVSPTGSGKTVMMAEVLRMLDVGLREKTPEADFALRALVGVPRLKIGRQTLGEKEQQGLKSFAPDLSVTGTGNGHLRREIANVTIACYQSWPGMERSGELNRLNPNVIAADEMHLIINGKASETLRRLLPGRLAVGFSATPSYSETRTAFDIFPLVGMHETIRDGIANGYISPLEVRLIQASSRIIARRTRLGELNEEDVFQALKAIPDFNLIQAIVANQVQRKRKGIIHCPPGHDRLISRELARRLSRETVDSPDGKRRIRAVHVDGDTKKKELDATFADLDAGKIDVVTNVDLANVGWDGDVDYGINTRPVMSPVYAEQGMGRVMRPKRGKVAEYFDLVYQIASSDQTRDRAQVTAVDVLNEKIVVQGHRFSSSSVEAPKERSLKGKLDPKLRAAMTKLDQLPIDEVRISNGQQAVPSDWRSDRYLGYIFGMDEKEVNRQLARAKIGCKTEINDSDGTKVVLYPDRAEAVLAERLGVEPLQDDDLTITRIMSDPQLHRGRSITQVRRLLTEEGCELRPALTTGDKVMRTYGSDAREILNPTTKVDWGTKRAERTPRQPAPKGPRLAKHHLRLRPQPPVERVADTENRQKEDSKKPIDKEAIVGMRQWLQSIMVDTKNLHHQQQKVTRAGQANLATQLRMAHLHTLPKGFTDTVRAAGLRPTDRMRTLMKEHNVDFPTLLYCCRQAERVTTTTILRGTL